ncbi:hypothetical protein F4820DRAFT_444664 [Hypoxylon rubiginosum]|uniref:Uncharacterized protein n=1 Tax=Hypoxylon rubiginosum TaxID=110542 RepID=A0ACB9ZAI4_9PEZI|nr:hypothetical protein F4820DRAFT_444664 [Hypoxylon rubiginosum]
MATTQLYDNGSLVEAERPKGYRRSHRKSRLGCLPCKRRKVKCDEASPACRNCIRFGIGCEYSSSSSKASPTSCETAQESSSIGSSPTETFLSTSIPRRRRGRPRKDWNSFIDTRTDTSLTSSSSLSLSLTTSLLGSPIVRASGSFQSLNIADAELLLQYISSTAQSLVGAGDPTRRFWAYEVPKMGLSNEFLLHLVLAVAGHHLARLEGDRERANDCQSRYVALTRNHFQAGLAGFKEALPTFSKSNGVALYVSAILVCWCSFATGPVSDGDLLVCDVDSDGPTRWMPLVQGVRILRTAIESSDFSSALEVPGKFNRDNAATYFCAMPTSDWEKPLRDLHDRIVSSDSPNVKVYLRALHDMQGIFEDTFGKSNGSQPGSLCNRFVLGWIYRMEASFVGCLRAAEPLALLILAHYAVLLGTMNNCWFLKSWTEHLIVRVEELLGPDYDALLQWPKDQIMCLGSDHGNIEMR